MATSSRPGRAIGNLALMQPDLWRIIALARRWRSWPPGHSCTRFHDHLFARDAELQRRREARFRPKISKTTPCKVTSVAGMDALTGPAKTF
jgi:hypothetical protein